MYLEVKYSIFYSGFFRLLPPLRNYAVGAILQPSSVLDRRLLLHAQSAWQFQLVIILVCR